MRCRGFPVCSGWCVLLVVVAAVGAPRAVWVFYLHLQVLLQSPSCMHAFPNHCVTQCNASEAPPHSSTLVANVDRSRAATYVREAARPHRGSTGVCGAATASCGRKDRRRSAARALQHSCSNKQQWAQQQMQLAQAVARCAAHATAGAAQAIAHTQLRLYSSGTLRQLML